MARISTLKISPRKDLQELSFGLAREHQLNAFGRSYEQISGPRQDGVVRASSDQHKQFSWVRSAACSSRNSIQERLNVKGSEGFGETILNRGRSALPAFTPTLGGHDETCLPEGKDNFPDSALAQSSQGDYFFF